MVWVGWLLVAETPLFITSSIGARRQKLYRASLSYAVFGLMAFLLGVSTIVRHLSGGDARDIGDLCGFAGGILAIGNVIGMKKSSEEMKEYQAIRKARKRQVTPPLQDAWPPAPSTDHPYS